MFARFHLRLAVAAGAAGTAALACCGTAAASGGTAGHPGARAAATSSGGYGRFSRPLPVSNRMFPLQPGTQLVFHGKVLMGQTPVPHTEVWTVTGLTKVVDHVRTVVVWDRDIQRRTLQEQELAFFAQDDQGNVWNFGEYPELFTNGRFTGAPDTWIRGAPGTYGGLHMLARPRTGIQYREGLVPRIGFNDMSRVGVIGRATCVPAGCYRHLVEIVEWSPNDPSGGTQLKYYAPHVGLVRVGALGGNAQEYLSLTSIRHLSPRQIASVCAAVRYIERRAYRVSSVYRLTSRATGC
jgi:hypothetical protein